MTALKWITAAALVAHAFAPPVVDAQAWGQLCASATQVDQNHKKLVAYIGALHESARLD